MTLHLEDVLKRTEAIIVKKRPSSKGLQSLQIEALAQALVEAINKETEQR
jgi:hypothetical protein